MISKTILLPAALIVVLAAFVGAAEPPNIVFIFADDWGWGDLSCHGNKDYRTPHLDRLASEGTEFYQFTVGNPVCSPSRTAVMTGHFPARHRIHRHFSTHKNHVAAKMPDWLDPQVPMLPRLLKKAGYVTGHFGKWHLTNQAIKDAPLPTAYGFDEYAAFNLPDPQTPPEKTYEKAIDFIRRHKDERFFLNLWIHETHTPHYPKKPWLEKFKHLEKQQQVYAAVVGYADYRIGQVLQTLEELDLADDTLVVFSSDNGPERTGSARHKKQADRSTSNGLGTYYSVGSTGGLKGRKRSLFAGGVGVPFFVRWPGHVPAGKIDKTSVVTAVDLLPTLCAAAGAKLPDQYQPDGENMLPAMLGKATTRTKPIFWEWRGPAHGQNWPRLGVRDGTWKLLMTYDRGRVELYDVVHDRAESKNLAQVHPEIARRLADKATAWKKSLDPSASLLKEQRK